MPLAEHPPATPELSVVVPSVNGGTILLECLAALQGNADGGARLEVLVIDRCGDAVREPIRRRFPQATIVAVPADTTIPAMRAVGFRHAHAGAVAVIEDHVIVPRDWARQLLDALAAGHDVVGGSVDNAATTTTVDWAAFLCEYSHLLPPIPGGEVSSLTGNNVAYRRELLDRYATTIADGRWEDHLHAAMRRDGVALTCFPEIRVGHKMHYRIRDYLGQRYLYARAYAGLKRAGMAPVMRSAFAAGALALPPVLLFRIVRRVLATGGHRRQLLQSLPLLALFVCAWGAGEAAGYAAGGGDALSRVT